MSHVEKNASKYIRIDFGAIRDIVANKTMRRHPQWLQGVITRKTWALITDRCNDIWTPFTTQLWLRTLCYSPKTWIFPEVQCSNLPCPDSKS